ncbi:MAG: hypothetical protein A2Y15_04825 [Clostridiales bacterium GWF2_36_10]|nr:MAG: hypothetical protein A2Y15_04825 [Clostridiales bacterium GWF2_36_10]
MDNTIINATTGMLARQKSMNITSNNLSNIETVGYKRSDLILNTFGEYMTYKVDNGEAVEIGTKTHGVVSGNVYNDFEQGAIYDTNRTLDFAINGVGFFTVINENGEITLTRDGRFNVDDNGFLMDALGNFIMGQNGTINVGVPSEITVSETGIISSNGNAVNSFLITIPDDTAAIVKLANGQLTNPGGTLPFTGKIIQGSLEHSNVNLIEEMAAMIEDSRAYQSCSQIIKMADQLLQKTVNEIGRV